MLKKIAVFLFVSSSLIFTITQNVFFESGPLSSGDWSFQYLENIKNYPLIPSFWNSELGNGMGGNSLLVVRLNHFFLLFSSLAALFFSWSVIERIFWFFPSLVLPFLICFYFYKKLFNNNFFSYFSAGIYSINTYNLMLVSGGQLSVSIAYALIPIIFLNTINIISSTTLKKRVFFMCLLAIFLGLQTLYYYRITYITIIGIFLFGLFYSVFYRIKKNPFVFIFIVLSISFSFLTHAYWIVPLIQHPPNIYEQFDTIFTSENSVKFFSFADFSHTLSFLHPNWPENIFGKVSFLRPEFLLLPILAFSSLLFINKKQKTERVKFYILFFAFIGILGSFLAKGAREPFGFVYLWMFENVPGFIMFRDPTKWYVLIAISYAMLIPFSISQIYEWLRSRKKFSIFNFQYSINSKYFTPQNIFLLFVILCFMFLLRPALMGELGGTFKPSPVPQEYIQLKDFLHEDEQFSRTLWVPQKQRFGFTSNTHPGISAQNFFDAASLSGVLEALEREETRELLQSTSVRYVIVPYDSKGELFLTDREYDAREYERAIAGLDGVDWLTKTQTFGDIIVYEVPSPKDHFYTDGSGEVLSWERVSATEYTVTVSSDVQTLIFSEGYDPGWVAEVDGKDYPAEKYSIMNMFRLPGTEDKILITYSPQKDFSIGLVITIVNLVVLIIVLLGSRLERKKIKLL